MESIREMRWPWSKPKHIHQFGWHMEPWGPAAWLVFTRCDECQVVGVCTSAVDREDLNLGLARSFKVGLLSPLGYYSAPTDVPYVREDSGEPLVPA